MLSRVKAEFYTLCNKKTFELTSKDTKKISNKNEWQVVPKLTIPLFYEYIIFANLEIFIRNKIGNIIYYYKYMFVVNKINNIICASEPELMNYYCSEDNLKNNKGKSGSDDNSKLIEEIELSFDKKGDNILIKIKGKSQKENIVILSKLHSIYSSKY